jgi:hypothetical protein
VNYVGYESKEITVANAQKVTISLVETKNKQLNEVVVVGYGTQRKAISPALWQAFLKVFLHNRFLLLTIYCRALHQVLQLDAKLWSAGKYSNHKGSRR